MKIYNLGCLKAEVIIVFKKTYTYQLSEPGGDQGGGGGRGGDGDQVGGGDEGGDGGEGGGGDQHGDGG